MYIAVQNSFVIFICKQAGQIYQFLIQGHESDQGRQHTWTEARNIEEQHWKVQYNNNLNTK